MSVGDAYIRIYYRVLNDPKFETIYEDDHHLATWVRLLMVADQMWPADAPVPQNTRAASMKALMAVGLVDTKPKHCYRIHGLDAERLRRSSAASKAAWERWHKNSNAPASPPQSGSDASYTQTESKTETETKSKGESAGEPRHPSPAQKVKAWLRDHEIAQPVGWQVSSINELAKLPGGPDAVIAAFEEARSLGAAVTCANYVRWAEQSLAPNQIRKSTPPAGHHGNAQEIADAFRA